MLTRNSRRYISPLSYSLSRRLVSPSTLTLSTSTSHASFLTSTWRFSLRSYSSAQQDTSEGSTGGVVRDDPSLSVYLGNLAPDTTEEQVRAAFGDNKISKIRLITNPFTGINKGFGFVVFEDTATKDSVLQTKELSINGRQANVSAVLGNASSLKRDPTKGGKRVYFRNISFESTKEAITNSLQTFGEVVHVSLPTAEDGRLRGFGYCEFATKEVADQAIAQRNITVDGRVLSIFPVNPTPSSNREGGEGGRREFRGRGDSDRSGERSGERSGGRFNRGDRENREENRGPRRGGDRSSNRDGGKEKPSDRYEDDW